MFRASLCPSSGQQDVCYCTWCAVLVLLDVVGSGCGAQSTSNLHTARTLQRSAPQPLPSQCSLPTTQRPTTATFTVLAPHNAAPHNRYQPHPTEPAQHTTCSNTRLVLLKMGIKMPETCWGRIDNKHLIVASCWFSFSLQNLLTMHGHRNLKRSFLLHRA